LVIEIIASLLASALEQQEAHQYLASWMVCDTLSRTSFAASSRSLSKLNSTVMELLPLRTEDVIFLIPSMELIASPMVQ
jgi:hypothetical protein